MDKQCKALIKASRKALALLNPDWTVASELRQALELAAAPALATRKATGQVNQRNAWMALASAEMDAWHASGQTVKAFHNGVLAGFRKRGMNAPSNRVSEHFDKNAVIADLELCACGHKASDHAKDELENLLKCNAHIEAIGQDCACDHFHYETVTKQAA